MSHESWFRFKSLKSSGVEAGQLVDKELTSRKEWTEGKKKLDFSCKLPGGEILVVREDKDGVAEIIINKDGKKLVDFSEFMPKGYKMITPTFYLKVDYLKNPLKTARQLGGWAVIRWSDMITIGDMKSPKSLFPLLHEIGHSWQPEVGAPNIKAEMVSRSSDERNAWARAINIARDIKRKYGINLFDVFENFDEFKKLMYGCLISHRFGAEKELIGSRDNANRLKIELDELMHFLFGAGLSAEEKELIRPLFDKGKFSKKSSLK